MNTLPKPKNRLYSIQEAAKLLGVSPMTLRRWEVRGILIPQRTRGNQRRYAHGQLERFKSQRQALIPHVPTQEVDASQAQLPQAAKAFEAAIEKITTPQDLGPASGGENTVEANSSSVQTDAGAEALKASVASAEAQSSSEDTSHSISPSETSWDKKEVTVHVANDPVAVSPQKIQNDTVSEFSHDNDDASYEKKLTKFHKAAIYIGMASFALFLVGIFSLVEFGKFGLFKGSTTPKAVDLEDVLAAESALTDFTFSVNIPSRFLKDAVFEAGLEADQLATFSGGIVTNNANGDFGTGIVIASNIPEVILSGITEGDGLTVDFTDPANPTISNNGVLSLQGETGEVTLSEGDGIDISGTTITNTGVTSLQGSTGDVSLTAGSGISISGTTISANGTYSQWTTTGSDIYYNTGNVGIGTTLPAHALDVTGSIRFGSITDGLLKVDSGGVVSVGLVQLGSEVTGVLPVANGGTGATSLTDLIALGTNTTGNFVATITGNSQITVTGSGVEDAAVSLSIAADSVGDSQLAFDTGQHLTVTSSPSFDGLSLNTLSLGGDSFTELVGDGLQRNGTTLEVVLGSTVALGSEVTGVLPVANGGTGTNSQFTEGSLVFAGASGVYSQNNAQLFWDNTTTRLGIGTTAPLAKLDVAGSASVSGNLTFDANAVISATRNQNLTIGSASTGDIILSGFNNCTALETNAGGVLSCGVDDGGGGGGGISTIQEDNSNIVASATIIDFVGTDFAVTNPSAGRGLIGIDYVNSNIVRSDQSESISGIWTFSSQLGVGNSPVGKFDVTGSQTGKALVLLNETGDQDIFTASSSGTTRFTIGNSGILTATAYGEGVAQFSSTGVLSSGALNLAGGANFVSGILPIANGGTGSNTLADLIQLGTHTQGNYVATVAGSDQISVSGSGNEDAAVTLSIAGDSIGDDQLEFDTGQHLTSTSSPTFDGLSLTDLTIGGDTIGDFVGTGLQLNGSTLETTLGTSVDLASAEVTGILDLANGGTGANLTAVQGGIVYSGGSSLAISDAGNAGQVLLSGGTGAPTWADASSLGTNYWDLTDGALTPKFASTVDLLIGGTSTESAKFAILNINDGTPVASVSSGLNGAAIYLSADGSLQTANRNTLTLGGSTTGNIVIDSGTGNITLSDSTSVNGNISASGTTGIVLSGNSAGLNFTGAGTHTIEGTGTLQINAFTLGGAITGGNQNISAIGNISANSSTNTLTGFGTIGTSGTTDFVGKDLTLTGTTTFNGVTYTWPGADAAIGGYVLSSDGGGTLSWIDISDAMTNHWVEANGALYAKNPTTDFLIGGSATNSAKFAVLNMAGSGSPVASVSAIATGNAISLSGDGAIQTALNRDLTIGGNTTGAIQFSPNNTQTMTLVNGNVGIGTTTPGSYKLNVVGNSAITGNLDVTNGVDISGADLTLATGVQIDFADEIGDKLYLNSNTYGIGIESDNLTTWSGSAFRWRVGGTSVSGGTEVMTLSNSGNLQIDGGLDVDGASSDIAGTLNLSGSTLTSSGILAINASNNNDVNIGNGDLFVDTSEGNVGIGTTTPGARLDVIGNVNISGTATSSALAVGYNGLGAGTGNAVISGNVGIGTSSPTAAKFEILSDSVTDLMRIGYDASNYFTTQVSNTGVVTFDAAGSSAGFTFSDPMTLGIAGSADGSLTFQSSGSDIDPATITMDSSGNLTIQATQTGASLVLGDGSGDIRFNPGTDNIVMNLSSTGDLLIQDNGTTYAIFDDSGNVGFGTTAPIGRFNIEGAATGKALTIINETGDQNILSASASGTTRFNLTRTGLIETADLTLGLNDTSATISTYNTDEDLTLDPNGTGLVYFHGSSNSLDSSGNLTLAGDVLLSSGNYIGLLNGGRLGFTDDTTDEIEVLSANMDLNTNLLLNIGHANTDFTAGGGLNIAGLLDVNGNLAVADTDIAFDGASTTFTVSGAFTLTPGGAMTLGSTGQAATLQGSTLALTSTGANNDISFTAADDLFFDDGTTATQIPLTDDDTTLATPTNAIIDAINEAYAAAVGGTTQFTLSGTKIYPTVASHHLGIGTTTASDIISSLYVTRNLASGATGKALAIFNQTENQDILAASSSGTTRFVIQNNGNVGIGLSNPTAYLNIAANTTAKPQIKLTSSTGVDVSSPTSGDLWWNGTNLYFHNGTTSLDLLSAIGGNTQWGDNGNDIYYNSGNVGIGTTSPEAILELRGGEAEDAGIALNADEGDDNADTWFIISQAADNDLSFQNHTTEYMKLTTQGNLSIEGFLDDLSGTVLTINDDLEIEGNDILDSGSNIRITLGATTTLTNTALTLSGTSTINAASLSTFTTAASLSMGSTSTLTLASNATINGGASANDDLILQGTSSSTRDSSYVLLQPNGGNVGIGVTAPTGFLNIGANTTGKSQIRLTSSGGTDVSSPESGDLWWNGTNLYFNNGTVNRDILGASSQWDNVTGGINFPGGNVGIGTTSPVGKFNVSGTGNQKVLALIQGDGHQDLFTASSSGSTKFLVDKSGNVGIGTTAPAAAFDMRGNRAIFGGDTFAGSSVGLSVLTTGGSHGFAVENNSSLYWTFVGKNSENDNQVNFGGGSSTEGAFEVRAGGTAGSFLVDHAGNVGIGTTGPGAKLDVLSSSVTPLMRIGYDASNYFSAAVSSAGAVSFDAIGSSAGFAFSDPMTLGVAGSSNGSLTFESSGTDIDPATITMDSSGNLTIQATQADASVIIGDGAGDIVLEPGNDDLVANLAGTGDFLIQDNGTTFAIFTDSGNVGIGTTTPVGKLNISGTGNQKVLALIQGDGHQDLFTASESGTTRFLIQKGGNVGIGTTSTTAKLDVAGTGRFTGNLEVETTLNLGESNSTDGQLVLRNDSNSNTVTVKTGDTSSSYTLTLPTTQGTTGQCLKLQDTNGTLAYEDCITSDAVNESMPVGSIIATGRSTAPAGYLIADGSSVSNVTYPDLYDAIGETFGTGSDGAGGTSFSLPDLRGRVPVGVDGSAGRITVANDDLGESGGEERHLLTAAESGLPDHVHTGDSSVTFNECASCRRADGAGATVTNAAATDGFATGGVSGGAQNASTAHNIMQPYLVVNWMIRAENIEAGADLAEKYYSHDDSITAGDIVSIDGTLAAGVKKSTKAYDKDVMGIVSTKPGIVLGDDTNSGHPVDVALAGRVPVKVTTANGPIKVGDEIVASDIPGVGMRASKPGYIVGKAMEAYANPDPTAIGKVMVFVTWSFVQPEATLTDSGNINLIEQQEADGKSKWTLMENGKMIEKIGIFSDVLSASISAGIIDAKEMRINGVNILDFINSSGGQPASAASSPEYDNKFAELTGKIEELTQKTSHLEELIGQTASEAAFLRDILGGSVLGVASDSASLGEALENLDVSDDATIGNDLTVLGRTRLNDVGIAGSLTAGVISVDGLAGEINTVGESLKLQSLAAAPIEMMNGKVKIAINGDITTKGEVTTKKINIDETDEDSKALGEVVIPIGGTYVDVTTTALTTKSRIFVSPDSPIAVGSKATGTATFRISLQSPATKQIKVNWWIVN